MNVFLVPATSLAGANAAAGEQMFQREVPFGSQAPTHYVAGWANIPGNIKTAILAAGAVEYDTLDAALLASGISPPRSAEEKLAAVASALDAVTDPVLVTDVVDIIREAIA